jgi:hypothetical protein
MTRANLLLALVALAACKDKDAGDTGFVEAVGPTLEQQEPDGGLSEGGSVDLVVAASDPDGVAGVIVFHRTEGSSYWDTTPMEPAEGQLWTATLDELYAPGVEYYYKGVDNGTPQAESFLPDGGQAAPYVLAVSAEAAALPWTEDFELVEGETSLFTLGWWSPSIAFNGYPFQLTQNRAASGESGVYHPRGSASVGGLEDWLISPALDLSTLPAAMVTWQELGVSTSVMGVHGLYISTTSRDPVEGGFQAVDAELAAPLDGEWGRSKAFDLSAWAGNPQVYLGWKYVGEAADDWYIDDVTAGPLAADLTASLLWLPDPVGPGERAAVTVVLTNEVDAAATDLSATLTLPEGGGVLVDETVSVGTVDGLGSGQADFELDLDAGLAENRYLPLAVEVTDGEQTWNYDLRMTVGVPSEAVVSVTVDAAVSANVVVGVGDPDDPIATETVWAGLLDAGSHDLELDVTDWYELLPPGPGEGRWFAEISADGVGTVDGFAVVWGGEETTATRLASFGPDFPATVYAPEPPSPSVLSSSPTSASPGDTGLPMTLIVRNDGEASSGPVTGELVAVDGDVSVSSGATFSLDADIWQAGEQHVITGPQIDIGLDHADSTPAQFALVLSDGVESWTANVEVAVPWPVLKITGVVIDDTGGDGVLDPGESADIELTVVNTGALAAFAPLDGTLRIADSSTATATITSADGSFGRLTAGSDRDDDFALTVDSGSVGDTLDLVLDLTDGTADYAATVQLALGEAPWLSLSSTDDALGDNLDGYGFDFVNARYRVSGTQVEIWLSSDVPIDPGTLFIEAWGTSSGSDYTYYRWVMQSGSGTFQGYTGSAGFQTIGTLTATFPGDDDVILSFDSTDMGLLTDSFSLGLAAGWCGPPDYYCDHFPDYWGYPYDAFSSSRWFDIRW